MSTVHDETMNEIAELLARVCALSASEVDPEGELLGYGLDSVLTLDLLLEIEQRWGISLPEHDPALRSVVTVRDLVRVVNAKRASA